MSDGKECTIQPNTTSTGDPTVVGDLTIGYNGSTKISVIKTANIKDYVTLNGKPVSQISGAEIKSIKFVLDGAEIPQSSLQCSGNYKMQITVAYAGKTGYLNRIISGC